MCDGPSLWKYTKKGRGAQKGESEWLKKLIPSYAKYNGFPKHEVGISPLSKFEYVQSNSHVINTAALS